jgi:hypothetical protein
MSESQNGKENVQSSGSSSLGNIHNNMSVPNNNIFENYLQSSPLNLQNQLINTQPPSAYKGEPMQPNEAGSNYLFYPEQNEIKKQLEIKKNEKESEKVIPENNMPANNKSEEKIPQKAYSENNRIFKEIKEKEKRENEKSEKVEPLNNSKEYFFMEAESVNKLGVKIDSLIDKVGTLSGKIDSLVEKIDVSNSNQENLLNEMKASNKNQEKLLYILGKKFFPEEEEFQKPLSESDDKKKVDAKNPQ